MTGAELHQRREALNLTQAQLAEALGLKQHHLSRWETGTVPITRMRAAWLDMELSKIEQPSQRAGTVPRRPSA